VLVVHAERDALVPIEEGRRLAREIPDCRFVLLDSDNHMLLPDEPAWGRLLDEVQSFVSEQHALAPAAKSPGLALDELTPREREVLAGIAAGLDNTAIAATLGISAKTVRNHVSRVFDKIGAVHRYQAIVLAREAGLAGAGGRN
jgi:DNA-binding CsgD family transcriptional regulator